MLIIIKSNKKNIMKVNNWKNNLKKFKNKIIIAKKL